jgi:hypothetical protein
MPRDARERAPSRAATARTAACRIGLCSDRFNRRIPQIGPAVSAPRHWSGVARRRRDARFAASCVLDAAESTASRSS